MQTPLDIWRSEKVTNLLRKFYQDNFSYLEVEDQLSKSLIDYALEYRKSKESSNLQEISRIFSKVAKTSKKLNTEILPWTLFDLNNVSSFLDYGANKLDSINYIGDVYKNINELIAVDVVEQSRSFKYPNRSKYFEIDSRELYIPLKNNSVDFINVQFVLHHVINDSDIRKIFREFSRIGKINSRLLIWEETFEHNINDLRSLVNINNKIGISTDFNLTREFYELTNEERIEFIAINDWLINTNNKHMQWSMQYHPWEYWQEIANEFGFDLVQKYNFGLRINGRLKQGVHVVGEFVLIKN